MCIQNMLPYQSHIKLHRDSRDPTLVHVRLTPGIDNRMVDSAKQTPADAWLCVQDWLARAGHRRVGGWFTLHWRGVKRRLALIIMGCTRLPMGREGPTSVQKPAMHHAVNVIVNESIQFAHQSGERCTIPAGTVFKLGVPPCSIGSAETSVKPLANTDGVCQQCYQMAISSIAHRYCDRCETGEPTMQHSEPPLVVDTDNQTASNSMSTVGGTKQSTTTNKISSNLVRLRNVSGVASHILFGGWLDPSIPREVTTPDAVWPAGSLSQHWSRYGVHCFIQIADWRETDSLNQVAIHHKQYIRAFDVWFPRVVSLLCLDFLTF